jgi:hypothetical protein
MDFIRLSVDQATVGHMVELLAESKCVRLQVRFPVISLMFSIYLFL